MSESALRISSAVVRLVTDEDAFELRAPDIDLEPGNALACVGPSGSGKTTLIRLACGLIRTDRGAVHALGHDLASLDDAHMRAWRLANVGLVFQDFALLAHLSALENILLPFMLAQNGASGADERTRAHELARALEVDHTLTRRPARLSHGERQRIAICRALVTRPGILLCDEPTASLDERRADLVLSLIDREREERGAAVLITTHDRAVASRTGTVLDLAQGALS